MASGGLYSLIYKLSRVTGTLNESKVYKVSIYKNTFYVFWGESEPTQRPPAAVAPNIKAWFQ